MLTLNDFKIGNKLYQLDRNYPDTNNNVIEMTVRKDPESSELQVYGKQGYFTSKYNITEDLIVRMNNSPKPMLFKTKEEAVNQYVGEITKEVESLMRMPKEQILEELYNGWAGDHTSDYRIYEGMRKKIQADFGVRIP